MGRPRLVLGWDMTSRFPAQSAIPSPRVFRTWTSPDGACYRLVLEPPPRHRVRSGDRRGILTFVNLSDAKANQRTQTVAEDFVLEAASDAVLADLLTIH